MPQSVFTNTMKKTCTTAVIITAILLVFLLYTPSAFATTGSHDAKGGFITNIEIVVYSQTNHWQGYYGLITSGNSPTYFNYFNNSDASVGTIRKLELGASVQEGDMILITSSSSPPSLSELRRGDTSLIDSITGTDSDSGTNTFTNISDYAMPCTGDNIINVPTAYTFVDGQSQYQDFKEGVLKDGNNNPVFVVPVSSAPKQGFDNISYYFQFMVPNNNTYLVNYYMYYVSSCIEDSSGGGTGGSGVSTSEPLENIEKAERHEKSLTADKPVSYTFTAPELGIYEIIVTGEANEYDIALRVEVLKGTSKLVSDSPPGAVYKNLNVWAGTKWTKEALIRFNVENSWLDSNNIASVKMVRWDGSKWTTLSTTRMTKGTKYTSYEAKTGGFSSFAIVGLKEGEAVSTETPTPTVVSTPAGEKTPAPEATGKPSPGFEVLAAIVAVTGALYLRNKDRR